MEFIDLDAQLERIRPRIDRAIDEVLAHGRYILGPEVERFENELADFSGAREVVSCGNGTDALMLSLQALGMKRGDVIFVPSFTFAATAEAVAYLGGIPFFLDVRPDTFNLDVSTFAEILNERPELRERSVGVVPVDLFGHPADYEGIRRVAEEHGLWVLADAAQSFGAERAGDRVGIMGDATITSFFPAKPLGAYGDGGAVLTDDPALAETLRSLRVHGKGGHKYENTRVGMNSRLDSMQAAVLIEKLKIFDNELESRRAIADRYRSRLKDCVDTPLVRDRVESAWAQYTVKLSEDADRSAIRVRMDDWGIPTAVYYQEPLHRQPAYERYPRQAESLPVSEALASRVLSLPMHPYLTGDDILRVAESLEKALELS